MDTQSEDVPGFHRNVTIMGTLDYVHIVIGDIDCEPPSESDVVLHFGIAGEFDHFGLFFAVQRPSAVIVDQVVFFIGISRSRAAFSRLVRLLSVHLNGIVGASAAGLRRQHCEVHGAL